MSRHRDRGIIPSDVLGDLAFSAGVFVCDAIDNLVPTGEQEAREVAAAKERVIRAAEIRNAIVELLLREYGEFYKSRLQQCGFRIAYSSIPLPNGTDKSVDVETRFLRSTADLGREIEESLNRDPDSASIAALIRTGHLVLVVGFISGTAPVWLHWRRL